VQITQVSVFKKKKMIKITDKDILFFSS
jgi:hypothetical protein